MEKEIFLELIDKLRGIDYFFISGLSVAIHTNGKRKPGDIDLAIHEKDIDRFAKLLGTEAKRRFIDKGSFKVEDYGFVVDFEGQMIEATSGYPKKRIYEGKFNKLFSMKIKKKYFGLDVFVEPIEELLTQKAFMHREKDLQDLKLLRGIALNKNLILELAEDKGNKEEILSILLKEGFKV
jgi:hypothetical protein